MLRTSGFWIVVSSSYVTIYSPRHINVPANFFQWDKPTGSHPPMSRLLASNFSLLCSINYSLLIMIFDDYGPVNCYRYFYFSLKPYNPSADKKEAGLFYLGCNTRKQLLVKWNFLCRI